MLHRWFLSPWGGVTPFNAARFARDEGGDDAPHAGCRLPLAEGLALLSFPQVGRVLGHQPPSPPTPGL